MSGAVTLCLKSTDSVTSNDLLLDFLQLFSDLLQNFLGKKGAQFQWFEKGTRLELFVGG